ncbi:MAG: TetR/AcrR family transcriptional regulator [Actinobacteria bacterium]|nr:MAG: TetR/AcrR family transcriptional regulator [Actinomycetota bacterium]
MPKVSEEHLQTRRDQILAGARRTFARHGYEGATVARLEQEIGLSRGAIFNYYRDKWALFLALAAEDQHVFIDLLLEDGIDAVIRKIADENPDWLAVYFELARRMRTDPELMQEMRDRAPDDSRRADAYLAAVREQGSVRDDVDLTTLTAFINIVTNGVALASSLGLRVDVDELLKLVHRGIDPE